MMREDVDIENVLRRALARAGIVLGYDHACRRKGCGYSMHHDDGELRTCPTCHMKLWPKPLVRKIRFHDLRHTTASLLLMAGANPAAVQRILRHSDPRITTEVYGHLVPDYLRAEIDRLSFGIAPSAKPSSDSPALGALPTGLATSVLQPRPIEAPDKKIGPTASNDSEDFELWARRESNSLAPAPEGRIARQQGLAGVSKDAESLRSDEGGSGNALDQEAAFGRSFGPTLVQGSRLLTVREVAVLLRVCTATVYRLCSQGVLQHVRISNAVRVPADAVERHLRAGAS